MLNGRPIGLRELELFKQKLYLANQKRCRLQKARVGITARAHSPTRSESEPGRVLCSIHEGSTAMEAHGVPTPQLHSMPPKQASAASLPTRPQLTRLTPERDVTIDCNPATNTLASTFMTVDNFSAQMRHVSATISTRQRQAAQQWEMAFRSRPTLHRNTANSLTIATNALSSCVPSQ